VSDQGERGSDDLLFHRHFGLCHVCRALYFHTFKMALAPSPGRPRDLTKVSKLGRGLPSCPSLRRMHPRDGLQVTLPAVGKIQAGGAGVAGGYHPPAEVIMLVQVRGMLHAAAAA